jgi:hypothetical protein
LPFFLAVDIRCASACVAALQLNSAARVKIISEKRVADGKPAPKPLESAIKINGLLSLYKPGANTHKVGWEGAMPDVQPGAG